MSNNCWHENCEMQDQNPDPDPVEILNNGLLTPPGVVWNGLRCCRMIVRGCGTAFYETTGWNNRKYFANISLSLILSHFVSSGITNQHLEAPPAPAVGWLLCIQSCRRYFFQVCRQTRIHETVFWWVSVMSVSILGPIPLFLTIPAIPNNIRCLFLKLIHFAGKSASIESQGTPPSTFAEMTRLASHLGGWQWCERFSTSKIHPPMISSVHITKY